MSDRLENRATSKIGQIVAGRIAAVDPTTGLCRVATADPGVDIDGCVWLTKSFTAPVLGYRIKSLPSVDTQVLLLIGNPSFIIGVFDTPEYDTSFGLSLTKDGSYFREEYFKDELYPGYEGSASLLEGEFEIENAFNVGLSFLTNIISLSAGSRAKIEAHLLNDMVRIISEEYRHITPLGEVSVYDDGRPNMEVNFGSYAEELLDNNLPKNGDNVSLPALDISDKKRSDNIQQSIGHRFKTYVGYVGNFLNMFVSDPAKNLKSIASGKAQFHIGNSGDILLRTVSEIALERVVRIIVPTKRSGMEVPTPNYEENLDKITKLWDYGAGSDNSIHQCAYTLRSYARYLSNHVSLMRFNQLAQGDNAVYTVPKENEVPLPDMLNVEADLLQNNTTPAFIEGYSTIRIFRDGSVLSMDNTGGTVYHGRGIVEISAAKDVKLDAAGDISLVAGRHIFLKARKNIEISSIEGGIVAKSRKLINILCELGKIWIKSDKKKEETGAEEDYGILIDSTQSKLFINSKDNTTIQQEEGDLLIDCKKGNAFINAAQDYVMRSLNGNIMMQTTKDFICRTFNVFFNYQKLNFANKIFMTTDSLIIKLKAFIQGELQVHGNVYAPEYETQQPVVVPNCCAGIGVQTGVVVGDYNHVQKLGNRLFPDIEEQTDSQLSSKVSLLLAKIKKEIISFDKNIWKFQPDSKLNVPADGSKDALFMPHAQDFLETTEDPTYTTGYEDWVFSQDDKLKEAPRTDTNSFPYPGSESQEENYLDFATGENLNKPSIKAHSEWETPKMKSRKVKRKTVK